METSLLTAQKMKIQMTCALESSGGSLSYTVDSYSCSPINRVIILYFFHMEKKRQSSSSLCELQIMLDQRHSQACGMYASGMHT